jgi:hypothetical protein
MTHQPWAPIAYFVSSHGFGHAARSAAVMEALHKKEAATRCSVFTGVPEWFFQDSISAPFDYVPCQSDVGLIQTTPMDEDLSATVGELSRFLPLTSEAIEQAVAEVRRTACRLVVSDISPLGIAVASALGLPCALVENFTWDWIYRAYLQVEPRFAPFIDELQRLYSSVPLRIQAEPFCKPVSGAARVAPIARSVRQSRLQIRERLGLSDDSPFVLVTMGGFPASYRFLDRLCDHSDITFVLPGAADREERQRNLILLPHRTGFQHADLVSAADLVVGKLGYSTLAECFQAATPYLFIQRSTFPESPLLARWARQRLICDEITEAEFEAVAWPSRLYELSEMRTEALGGSAGSQQAAALLLDLLRGPS